MELLKKKLLKLKEPSKMKNDMKLIMESWRSSTINENTPSPPTTAEQYVSRIKLGLTLMAAKAAGKEALKQAIEELGPELVDAGLDFVKALPGIGNTVSAISGLWKSAGASLKAVMAAKAVSEATFEVLKIAAADYVEADDSKVSDGNPLAVLFNIDDKMEVPLKPEFLSNFAGVLLKSMQQSPDMEIPDPDSFAEEYLAKYLNNRGHLSDAKPPNT
jgi:hypothetical protein